MQHQMQSRVIIMHATLILNPEGIIQNEEETKPKYWLFRNDSDGLYEFLDCHSTYFGETRNRYLRSRPRHVHCDQVLQEGGKCCDMIDDAVKIYQNSGKKMCIKCNRCFDTGRFCVDCKSRLEKVKRKSYLSGLLAEPVRLNKYDVYNHFAINNVSNDIKVTVR